MLTPEFDLIDGGESGQRNGFCRRIHFVQCALRSCHKEELFTSNVLIFLRHVNPLRQSAERSGACRLRNLEMSERISAWVFCHYYLASLIHHRRVATSTTVKP